MKLNIKDHGPLIVETNYWESNPTEPAISIREGTIRLLLPVSLYPELNKMRSAKAIQVYQVDGKLYVLAGAVLLDFGAMSVAKALARHSGLVVTVWTLKKGKPHKALERPAGFRSLKASF